MGMQTISGVTIFFIEILYIFCVDPPYVSSPLSLLLRTSILLTADPQGGRGTTLIGEGFSSYCFASLFFVDISYSLGPWVRTVWRWHDVVWLAAVAVLYGAALSIITYPVTTPFLSSSDSRFIQLPSSIIVFHPPNPPPVLLQLEGCSSPVVQSRFQKISQLGGPIRIAQLHLSDWRASDWRATIATGLGPQ